jgi:predicted nucleic acid-binding Zn ribbon protein
MVTPLRDILRAAARAWGIEPAAHLASARAAWPRVVGEPLAAASAPLHIRGGRLRVAVTHPAAAQEIRLRAGAIAAAVNREIGAPVVVEVIAVARRRLPGEGSAAGGRDRDPART